MKKLFARGNISGVFDCLFSMDIKFVTTQCDP